MQISTKKRKDYRTDWSFVNNSEMDREVYNMVLKFGREGRAHTCKVLWPKYMVFLYLSAARRTEPFYEQPLVEKFADRGEVRYHIRRVNEKHFTTKIPRRSPEDMKQGKPRLAPRLEREVIDQYFKPWNGVEQALFDYLLDGKSEIRLDFRPLLQSVKAREKEIQHFDRKAFEGRDEVVERLMANITKKFSLKFKADIKYGNEIIKNGGVVPHMLKHARVYSMKLHAGTKGDGLEDVLIQKTVGWNGPDMIYHYTDINRQMDRREVLDRLAKG